jgi:transcriptional regulator with XRE-family HTH domain
VDQEPHFAGMLRTLRAESGLTQEEVAGRAGLSARAVRDLECGAVRRPHRRTVDVLIAALDLGEVEARLLIDAAWRPVRSPEAADVRDDAARSGRRVPRQLPAGSQAFVGRGAELAILAEPAELVTVIGPGGIGKTALALSWAHSAVDRFPDGQLFVGLRGFDPCGRPVSPCDALGGFLHALGVVARQMPESVADRAALFRTLAADKRLLVVLDDAVDGDQVRPLLPAGPACRTVVTSRNTLAGLVAVEGARRACSGW